MRDDFGGSLIVKARCDPCRFTPAMGNPIYEHHKKKVGDDRCFNGNFNLQVESINQQFSCYTLRERIKSYNIFSTAKELTSLFS